MIAELQERVTVKLDGKYVNFEKVEFSARKASTDPCVHGFLDIKLTLSNGEVINDNGLRVEVIVYNTETSSAAA